MKTVALTLWFTLTTLLGPGVCRCSLAAATADLPIAGQPEKAPRPVKSCCEHKSAPAGTKIDRATQSEPHQSQPHKPSECPCESEKQVTSLPPKGLAAASVELLAGFDALPSAGLSASHVIVSVRPAPDRCPSPLAGRDLLAAYSVLRC
jgi:hypothetical protein